MDALIIPFALITKCIKTLLIGQVNQSIGLLGSFPDGTCPNKTQLVQHGNPYHHGSLFGFASTFQSLLRRLP